MIIRKMLIMALVVVSGAQSIVYAAEAPKAKAESTESWATWYKRNKVLVGAAAGAVIVGALACAIGSNHNGYMNVRYPRRLYGDVNHYMPEHYIASSILGGVAGAIAAKLNALTGFCLGTIMHGVAFYPSITAPVHESRFLFHLTALLGGAMGAGAQKRNTLPGFIMGSVGLGAARVAGSSDQDASLFALSGAIIGAGVNELYNSDQAPEEDKQNKE